MCKRGQIDLRIRKLELSMYILMVGIDSVEVVLSMSGGIINSRFHDVLFVRVCACVSVDSEKLRDLWSRHSGLAASSECLSGLLGLLLGSAASRWDGLCCDSTAMEPSVADLTPLTYHGARVNSRYPSHCMQVAAGAPPSNPSARAHQQHPSPIHGC